MLVPNNLFVSRHNGLWMLSEKQGFIACSDNSNVLYDCLSYAKIHKVRSLDDLKARFSDTLIFLR